MADELSNEAMRRNKTLYAFANESLGAVISVCKLSGEPSEILTSWKMGRMLKDIDAVPLPGDLVEKLTKKLYDVDRIWLLDTWQAEGRRVGSYLKMVYEDITALMQAAVEFQGLLPLKRIEFRNKDSSDSKGRMVLRAIGAGLSAESTACAEQLMRGIVLSYGWSVKNSVTTEGIIELDIVRDRH